MNDYYAVLGVARTATADEIKRAYRRLASQHHPDKGGDKARFQEIQAAYAVLSDADQRAEYDNPKQQFSFNFGHGPEFNQAFNFNDMFGAMFGQQTRRESARPTARMSLWITLLDVATPGRRTVAVGTNTGTHAVEIEIPAGINDNDSVQYAGIAPGGADLIITFRIKPNPQWERRGNNLYTETNVDFWQAITGDQIYMLDIRQNKLELTIPARCNPGTILRIRGRGLPDRSGQLGDMYVRVTARMPARISPELAKLIENEVRSR